MNIDSFDDFLRAARAQSSPQRLLFVFANAVLPDEATVQQRTAFESGEGGALVPQMCVDKSADDVLSFDALVHEAAAVGPAWQLVFAGAISEKTSGAVDMKHVEESLRNMVDSIKQGRLVPYLAFDKQGFPVSLQ